MPVELTWDANAAEEGVTQYVIRRRQMAGGRFGTRRFTQRWRDLVFLPPTATTYTDGTADDAIPYQYSIRARNANGLSAESFYTALVVNYFLNGTVTNALTNAPIANATISITNLNNPDFGQRTTGANGRYNIEMGAAPPGPPANRNIFCVSDLNFYRIVALNVPMPTAAAPRVICDFQMIPRMGLLPPAAVPAGLIPPNYDLW